MSTIWAKFHRASQQLAKQNKVILPRRRLPAWILCHMYHLWLVSCQYLLSNFGWFVYPCANCTAISEISVSFWRFYIKTTILKYMYMYLALLTVSTALMKAENSALKSSTGYGSSFFPLLRCSFGFYLNISSGTKTMTKGLLAIAFVAFVKYQACTFPCKNTNRK